MPLWKESIPSLNVPGGSDYTEVTVHQSAINAEQCARCGKVRR